MGLRTRGRAKEKHRYHASWAKPRQAFRCRAWPVRAGNKTGCGSPEAGLAKTPLSCVYVGAAPAKCASAKHDPCEVRSLGRQCAEHSSTPSRFSQPGSAASACLFRCSSTLIQKQTIERCIKQKTKHEHFKSSYKETTTKGTSDSAKGSCPCESSFLHHHLANGSKWLRTSRHGKRASLLVPLGGTVTFALPLHAPQDPKQDPQIQLQKRVPLHSYSH